MNCDVMPCGAGELEIVLMVISIEQQWVEQPDGLSGSFNHLMDDAYPQTRS
jgi:hypothetical protein